MACSSDMKKPAEYLATAPVYGSPSGPVVTKADAEKAIADALKDAEQYKDLLLAALRRKSGPSQHTPLPAHTLAAFGYEEKD
jgi:hypothetical protein